MDYCGGTCQVCCFYFSAVVVLIVVFYATFLGVCKETLFKGGGGITNVELGGLTPLLVAYVLIHHMTVGLIFAEVILD